MNNHYIPKFLLKNFSNKLYTYNLASKKTLKKDISKSFCINDFYPDWLEEKLNKKIETPFYNLCQQKLLTKNNFQLTKQEQELIAKFIILEALRINFERNIYVQDFLNIEDLTEERFKVMFNSFFNGSTKKTRENLENVVKREISEKELENYFKSLKDLMKYDLESLAHFDNLQISFLARCFSVGKLNIIDISHLEEDFIINDVGYITERDYGIKTSFFLQTGDFLRASINVMMPDNFIFYPISSKRAICFIHPFFFIKTNGQNINNFVNASQINDDNFFYCNEGNINLINIEIQQIKLETLRRLNIYSLNEVKYNLGFSVGNNILNSLQDFQNIPIDDRINDYSELIAYIIKKEI